MLMLNRKHLKPTAFYGTQGYFRQSRGKESQVFVFLFCFVYVLFKTIFLAFCLLENSV